MSADRSGSVTTTLPFSLVDGPGNRFVIFFQGCDFDCVACHNPYTINRCNGCGVCVESCRELALTLRPDLPPRLDLDRCTDCDLCVEACAFDSTPLATEVTVAEMLDRIRPHAPFLSGVTVSGGEATLQADFVHELFTAIRADPQLRRLTTFIDSNGGASRKVWDRLAPVTDGVMVDLKAWDPDVHHRLTGAPVAPVLDSISHLADLGLLAEVRLLIIGDENDDPASMAAAATWLHDAAPGVPAKMYGFRRHGTRPPAQRLREPSRDELERLAEIIHSVGEREVLVV